MSEQLRLTTADEAVTGALATPKPGPNGKHAVQVKPAVKVKPTPGPRHGKPEPKPAPSPKSFKQSIEDFLGSVEYERVDECFREALNAVSLIKGYSSETVRELAERPMSSGGAA